MSMTKKDFTLLAAEIADAGYALDQAPMSGLNDVEAHFRMVTVIGLACHRSNPLFNAHQWVEACTPQGWNTGVYASQVEGFTKRAIDAIEGDSLSLFGSVPPSEFQGDWNSLVPHQRVSAKDSSPIVKPTAAPVGTVIACCADASPPFNWAYFYDPEQTLSPEYGWYVKITGGWNRL